MTPRFTCGTADLGAADTARCGGKAAAIGELARAGLPVPRGYVVTVAAFVLHLDAADPAGASRRALGSLPADDLAGIDESVAYRRRQGIGEHGLAMGVVVQRMLSPRSAGVMFTRSPVTGDRSAVAIEATWGLGSALVSGEVTPDSFTVSKVTGEITGRRVGVKLRAHSFTPNGPGISATPMPFALRRSACLSDDEARALAETGRQVEDHYGAAQDIEWALLGERPCHRALHADLADRIVLLQSRPETVWAARDRAPIASPQAKASDHVLARFRRAL